MSSPTGVASDRAGLIRRILHWLFDASLLVKGTLASAETLIGLGLLLASNARLLAISDWFVGNAVAREPADVVGRVLRAIHGLSIETQHFYALYLLGHGGLKVMMVVGLGLRVLWTYPASMVLLGAFAGFELREVTQTHSPVLATMALLDGVMIFLVWRETLALEAARA